MPAVRSVAEARQTRRCAWCEASFSDRARRDSVYCSQRCRQAAWRFKKPSQAAAADASCSTIGAPRRFAYADPPYPGKARLYVDHPDFGGEVASAEVFRRLEPYEGWALSTSARALKDVLQLAPTGTRVAAWFRGPRPTRSYSPLSSWEPVLYFGCRHDASSWSTRRLDALVHVNRPRLTDTRRVIGAKPATFAAWLFVLLGLRASDELVDVYPGSRGVESAWLTYRQVLADRYDASRILAR